VLLAAGESAGLHALKAILDSPHRLVGVLAAPSASGFQGASVSGLAAKLGVPLWPARRVKDPVLADQIRAERVDLFLNVHSLYIVCPEVLAAARIGAFNLHPAPLPRYAGLNAPSWAIYRGERRHGVTLHWMVPDVDAGPIAYLQEVKIEESDTGLSLALRCVRGGIPLIRRLLDVAAAAPDAIPRVHQDLSQRQYFGAGAPDAGWLDWNRRAREVVNHVRAADYRPFPSPWGHPITIAARQPVGIAAARSTRRPTSAAPGTVTWSGDDGVEVAAGDEWVLIREVYQDGRYLRAAEALGGIARLGSSCDSGGWLAHPATGSRAGGPR
jgi:methionyl-tRNA formyltransferase